MLTGFTDFLLRYCQELGGTDCCDLRTLCNLAANNAARMMEPLFLYAAYSNKLDELLVLARDTRMEREYERLSELVRTYSADNCYNGMDKDESWPYLYRKVYDAYSAYLKHDNMSEPPPLIFSGGFLVLLTSLPRTIALGISSDW